MDYLMLERGEEGDGEEYPRSLTFLLVNAYLRKALTTGSGREILQASAIKNCLMEQC
jgi:hypothetical protein